MKNKTFGIMIILVSAVIIGGAITLSNNSSESTEAPAGEGMVMPLVDFIEFEPMEVKVPVTHLDFSNEEPTLITPDMKD